MARTLYGATLGDYAIDSAGRPQVGATFTVWDSLMGGVQVTDLLNAMGEPAATAVSDANGFVRLSGPDGWTDSLYAEDIKGTRYVLNPVDINVRVVEATRLLPLRQPTDPIYWDAADWANGDAPSQTQSGHDITIGGIGGVVNGYLIAYGDNVPLYFNVQAAAPITHVRGRFKVDNGSATTSGSSVATLGIWNQMALNADIRSPCHLAMTRTQIAYQVVIGNPGEPGNVPTVQSFPFATPLREGNYNQVLLEAWINPVTGRAKIHFDKGDERGTFNVPQHDGIKLPGSIAFWEVVNAAPAYERTYYTIGSGSADYVAEPYAGRRSI